MKKLEETEIVRKEQVGNMSLETVYDFTNNLSTYILNSYDESMCLTEEELLDTVEVIQLTLDNNTSNYVKVYTVEEYEEGCREDINSYSVIDTFDSYEECVKHINKYYTNKVMGISTYTSEVYSENEPPEIIEKSWVLLAYTLPTKNEEEVEVVKLVKE